MADVKPVQAAFPQVFNPKYGNIYTGSLMRNFYTEVHGDGAYAVKRSGLLSLGTHTLGFCLPVMGVVGWTARDPQGNNSTWPKYAWIFVKQLADNFYYYLTYNSLLPGTLVATPFFAGSEPLSNCMYWVTTDFSGAPFYNYVMQSGTDIFTVTIVEGPPLTFNATRVTQSISMLMPGIAFLDGTVYVMSQFDNSIHGCNIQDPTTWNALNVIGASTSWGKGVAVSRHLNYILGFFEFGLQVYYDAGLAPPASPLSPLPNASFLVGLAGQSSVVSLADSTIFIGRTAAGNISVYQLSGLNMGIISTPMVDAALNQHAEQIRTDYGADGQGGSVTAMAWNDKGTNFYVLTFQADYASLDPTQPAYSLAYNLSTQDWSVWTQNMGGAGNPPLDQGMSPAWNTQNLCAGLIPASGFPVPTTTFGVYAVSAVTYQDFSGSIDCMVLTANQNLQSSYKKFCSRLVVYADTIPDVMMVRYTDDDYNTYSGYATIDLSQKRKMTNRLGSFYQRAFEFTYTGNYPFRAYLYEMMLVGGSG